MGVVKRSFLARVIGREIYDEVKSYAKVIIIVGTCVLFCLFLLSLFVHWTFISKLLNCVTGTSLLFVIYVAAVVITLDIEVKIDSDESEKESGITSATYKFSIVWGCILLVLGIVAIIFTNKYRRHYAFECETFLVDHQERVYHLDWDNDCEEAAGAYNLEKMKGYQIDKTYTLCGWCEEWAKETESLYETDRFFRR